MVLLLSPAAVKPLMGMPKRERAQLKARLDAIAAKPDAPHASVAALQWGPLGRSSSFPSILGQCIRLRSARQKTCFFIIFLLRRILRDHVGGGLVSMPRNTRSRVSPFAAFLLMFGLLFRINFALSQDLTRETGRFGAWTTLEGFSDQVLSLCMLDATHNQLTITIMHMRDQESFLVVLSRPSWSFAQATPIRVSLRFGRDSWTYSGEAGGQLVTFWARYSVTEPFWNTFRLAREGSVDLLTRNGGSWRLDLNGSNAAITRYFDCVSRIGGSTRHFDTQRPQDDTDRAGTIRKEEIDDWVPAPEADNFGRVRPIPKTSPHRWNPKSPF